VPRTLAAFVVCAVLGIGLTFFLLPLWSWIEAFTGFESIGHTGPATWCFVATTLALFLCWWGWRRRRH
jgi:hypothetical protein